MEINLDVWNGQCIFSIPQYRHSSAYVALHHYLLFNSLSVGNNVRKLLKLFNYSTNFNYQKHETEESSSTSLHEDSDM